MLFGKTPETEGWQVRGAKGREGREVLKGKQFSAQTQILTRIINDLIGWIKFIAVMAMLSISLPLVFNVSGIFFFFFPNASLVSGLIISR